ncbi:MAG: acyl carrier protein, partial [Ruminococcaceae bacterium]|nr:acyl carrier protein [Oscillospiraceae bacterium]
MTKETILKDLEVIFQDIFDDEDIVLTEATNSDDIEDWDSLEQINLLVAIEKKYSIKFKLD